MSTDQQSLLQRLARGRWTFFGSEIWPLLAFGAVCLLGLAFLEIAEELREGETFAFDRGILVALHGGDGGGAPIGPPWLVQAAIELTALGSASVLALVTIGAVGFLAVTRKWKAALWLLLAAGGGALLTTLVKDIMERPRPDLVLHLVEVTNPSFPSGHAANSAAIFLTLGALLTRQSARKRIKAYVLGTGIVLTLMIGLTRIYLGVHWPSDVLAGWCLGAAWALLCWLAALWLGWSGKIESADSPRN